MTKKAILGLIDDPYALHAEQLASRMGPYSVERLGGKIEFSLSRKVIREKSFVQSTGWLANHNIGSFSLKDFDLSPGFLSLDRTQLSSEVVQKIPQILSEVEDVPWMERICRIVFNSSLSQMREVVTQLIASEFFKRCPKGKIKFFISTSSINIGLTALRIIGAANDLCNKDPSKFYLLNNFQMLVDLQGPGQLMPSNQLTIPLAMLLPSMYGFVANKVAFCFVFLLDEPIPEIRRPFPSSALDLFRSEASRLLGEAFEGELEDISPEKVDHFRVIRDSFSQSDLMSFINQYETKLNEFFLYLLDPSNFVSQATREWIGLRHYRAWLAFERLTDELTFLLTEQAPFLRKMALFRMIDQVSSLMSEYQHEHSQIFCELLLPEENDDPIHEGIKQYKGPVSKSLELLLDQVRSDLLKVAIDSVYVEELVDRESEIVSLLNGKKVGFKDYAANMIREIRNTYHGYHTRKFDDYLSISRGNTPDSLPALGLLIYFALIAFPEKFIQRTWN